MQKPRQALLLLLWDLHESECTDDRHLIAALYSLSDLHERPPLHYHLGDWKKVYEAAASYFVNNSTVTAYTLLIHLWGFGSIKSGPANEVPSWVPDWSAKCQEAIPSHPRESFPGSSLLSEKVGTTKLRLSHDLIEKLLLPYFPTLTSDRKRWGPEADQVKVARYLGFGHIRPSLNAEVSERRLLLNYSFLTFVYSCGVVDEVVYPSGSEDFWEDVVGLARWRKRKSDNLRLIWMNNATIQENKLRRMEIDSPRSLLVSVLAGGDPPLVYPLFDLRESVGRLCAGLESRSGRGSNFQTLAEHQKGLVQRFQSIVKHLSIIKIQATMGYYWAIGPPNVAKGDWFIPIVSEGQTIASLPGPQITPFLSLRPVGPKKTGKRVVSISRV